MWSEIGRARVNNVLLRFREYLKDLIESNHVFIKMLEHYCKRHRSLVVQKKPKVVKRKKKPKSKLCTRRAKIKHVCVSTVCYENLPSALS